MLRSEGDSQRPAELPSQQRDDRQLQERGAEAQRYWQGSIPPRHSPCLAPGRDNYDHGVHDSEDGQDPGDAEDSRRV